MYLLFEEYLHEHCHTIRGIHFTYPSPDQRRLVDFGLNPIRRRGGSGGGGGGSSKNMTRRSTSTIAASWTSSLSVNCRSTSASSRARSLCSESTDLILTKARTT